VDYIGRSDRLRPFYHRAPDISELIKHAGERADFSLEKRATLVQVLREQYSASDLQIKGRLAENLEMLSQSESRTVTTGHQLCLFGGPLYVFYKLLHIISQAERLNASNPGFYTLPVFWMATEDHDLEEVNHVHFRGREIRWETNQSGAVGRMEIHELEPLIALLQTQLGSGRRSQSAAALLREAYRDGLTLAQATRILVHAWFGDRGLVILDADDPRLKRYAHELFERELLESESSKAIQSQSEELARSYPVQAFVRPINVFYLTPGSRVRIEHRIGGFQTADGSKSWTRSELVEELHQHPERFSPNVLLRPLYQELILPNLAYTGGAGELAYWFQLKSAFENARIPMPVLILRQSFMWIKGKDAKVWNSSSLDRLEWFEPLDRFLKKRMAEHSPFDLELKNARADFDSTFDALSEMASRTDSSMNRAVEAERKRHQNALDRLSTRLIKAEKRRLHELVERWEQAHRSLFPASGLQERFDSYWDVYEYFGEQTLEIALEAFDPFKPEFILIRSID